MPMRFYRSFSVVVGYSSTDRIVGGLDISGGDASSIGLIFESWTLFCLDVNQSSMSSISQIEVVKA
jgi:hypothetical protein